MLHPFFSVRWLCNESLPPASRRWSVEGLAYLTFDADVKEDLVEDKNALLAMFDLAKVCLVDCIGRICLIRTYTIQDNYSIESDVPLKCV